LQIRPKPNCTHLLGYIVLFNALSVDISILFYTIYKESAGRFENGGINPEWLKLYQEFPGCLLIGSDQHYPESKGPQRWAAAGNSLT